MWQGIYGHDAIVDNFRRALSRGRLGSTYLFIGPDGIGKRTFALALAKCLFCEQRPDAALDACGKCPSCQQMDAGTNPDLHQVGLPEGKASIPIDLLVGSQDKRMREGLCYEISLKPFLGGRKVALINDADYLNRAEVANSLLKTLEEPPPNSLIILIGTSADKQLVTIRSRSQTILFQPLEVADIARILVEKQMLDDPAEARRLAEFSEGSLTRAVELTDREIWTFRGDLLRQLAHPRMQSVPLGKSVAAFVEAAGKEAPLRRARARLVLGFAAQFYRELLRRQAGLHSSVDTELRTHLDTAAKQPVDMDLTAARADRCLEAIQHVDRNANQSILLDAWADDLSHGRLAAIELL
ncbi:MAG: DNA polymerase III subunit delta' [Planctomycetota bacterium]|nr:DNA polymerase III subunit delta' [Planctomycetota bacterium]